MSEPHPSTETCELTSRDECIQLNHTIDQIDELIKMIVEKLLNNGREKLDKWRDDSYKMINLYYEQKCEELIQNCFKKIAKPKKDLDQIRLEICELIQNEQTNENDIQLLISNIQHIKQKIVEIQQRDIHITIQSFSINENLISIDNSISDDFNLSVLSSSYHTIHSSNSNSWSMASNNQFLLIDQYPHLYLLDQNLTIIKQYLWKYNNIHDICWSAILNKFIIITNKKVFLIDENLTSIEQIHSIKEQKWWSCACSNSSLYLITNERDTNIYQFNLSSLFQLIKQWKPPYSCKQDEFIYDITYQHEKLASIIIHSQNRTVSLIVRSSITFDLLWSFQLDINYKWFQTPIRCCSLTNDQWIIVEEYTSYIFHIDKHGNGKAKREYHLQPCNALVFGTDQLAIITEKSINFHRI